MPSVTKFSEVFMEMQLQLADKAAIWSKWAWERDREEEFWTTIPMWTRPLGTVSKEEREYPQPR